MCAPISNCLLHGISQVAEACHLEKVDTVEESDVDESAIRGISLAAERAGRATAENLDDTAETGAANLLALSRAGGLVVATASARLDLVVAGSGSSDGSGGHGEDRGDLGELHFEWS